MSKSFVSAILVIFFLTSASLSAQERSIYNGISVKGSAGLSMLQGDITIGKFSSLSDAKFGFEVSGIKMFSPFFGIQARYSSHNLSTIRTDQNIQYTGQVSEIGLAARIEPLSAIGPNGLRRVYPYARLGISNASFRAIRWNTITSQIISPSFGYRLEDLTNGPRENALSFPLAFGIGFRLSSKLSVEVEYNQSILNTDFLDAFEVLDTKNDMFGFLNIGIRYSLEPVYKAGIKNKRSKDQRSNGEELISSNRSTAVPAYRNDEEEIGAIEPFKNEIPYSTVFVESIIPDYPISGNLFEVLLRIHKGKYTGPATLTQTLPPGFTAIETPLHHAVLKFDNQQTTISWNQMPVDSIVTLRYHIHIDEKISGPGTIKGRIWYSQPDGNKSYQFVNQFLVTNRTEMEMDQRFLNILSERKSSSNPYSVSGSADNQKRQKELDKIVEDLMGSYQATGKISTSDMSKPVVSSTNQSIQKQLVTEKDLDEKIGDILGRMDKKPVSTLNNKVDDLITTYQSTGQIGTSTLTDPIKSNNYVDNKLLTETDLDQRIQNLIGQGQSSDNYTNVGTYNSPTQFIAKNGVEFRIQIGAFKTQGECRELIKKYNIRDHVTEEYHNGLYKCTVGSLNSYSEAQKFRDDFARRTRLLSVFIVGYKNGARQNDIRNLR